MRMLHNILFIEPQVLRTDRRVSLLSKFYFIFLRNFIFQKHCAAAACFLKYMQLSKRFMCDILTTTSNEQRQYSKTNVMHILFNLLRIKGLYMF
jgi:hypothetical protein